MCVCVCVRSHLETVGTLVWLVSSVSAELAVFCLSEWPDPSEEDTLVWGRGSYNADQFLSELHTLPCISGLILGLLSAGSV